MIEPTYGPLPKKEDWRAQERVNRYWRKVEGRQEAKRTVLRFMGVDDDGLLELFPRVRGMNK